MYYFPMRTIFVLLALVANLSLGGPPAPHSFKVQYLNKFGRAEEGFTGYLPPTSEQKSHRMYRSFPPNKGAYAFQDIPKEFTKYYPAVRIFRQQCGDCWAEGAITIFETLVGYTDNVSPFFSRQNQIDCSDFGGCGGGQLSVHFLVKGKGGAVAESDVPYKGSNQKCKAGIPYKAQADSAFYMKEDATWPEYQRALMETGPIEVCGASSALGNGGWVSKNPGGGIDHCYGLIGWYDGATHGKPAGSYAIIANSWGTNWGADGYGFYLMARDGIHFDGNVIVEGAGVEYKAACSPQPVANAGPDKSILVGE